MPELVEWATDRRLGRGKFALHEDPMVDTASLEPPSRCIRWCRLRYDDVATQSPPERSDDLRGQLGGLHAIR